jgi:hypothetical protein
MVVGDKDPDALLLRAHGAESTRRARGSDAETGTTGLNPDAQPEAIPDLELRQPGTGQGAITTPRGRGTQLTAIGLENVPEGSGVLP